MSKCVVRMDIDEMPTACGPCELSCTAICKEWTKVDRKEIGRTKSPNCPILAILPEGHGRLVDADELSKYWKCRIALMNSCSGKRGILESVEASTIKSCIEDMGSAKTIVPAEAERSET